MIILDIPTMIRIFGELDDRRKKLMADKIVEKESKKYER